MRSGALVKDKNLIPSFVRFARPLMGLALAAGTLAALTPVVHAQTLTDLTLFRLDSNNNTIAEG